jgi:hypothetical protein
VQHFEPRLALLERPRSPVLAIEIDEEIEGKGKSLAVMGPADLPRHIARYLTYHDGQRALRVSLPRVPNVLHNGR